MKRFVDGLLIAAVLAAVALGAYAIGHRVDNESNKLANQDPELNVTTSATGVVHSKSHETPIIIAGALGGAVVLLLLGSGVNAMMRSRRRESWRAG